MAYSAGTAFLQIVPSFKGVERALRQQAAELGAQLDQSVAKALPDGMAEGGRQARRHGEKAGDDYSGAFATRLREQLKKAFKQLPAVELKSDSSEAEKAIARIKKTLKEVRDQHIDLEIDDKTALAAVRRLREELRQLNNKAVDVTVRTNTAAALKEVDKIADLYNDHLNRRLAATGALSGDRFGSEFRKHVQASLKSLPELSVKATTTAADEALDEIRRELKGLANADIGIDIDDREALLRLAALQARLKALRDTTEDVRLRVNVDGALASLEKFDRSIQQKVEEPRRLRVEADDDGSLNKLNKKIDAPLTRFGALISLGAAIGPAIVPGIAAATAALGFLGTAAGSVLAGVGVAALGLSGISDAVKALDAYQNDANKSAKSLGQSENQVANAVDGVTAASRALATARADAGFAAKRAAETVEQARKSETRAERDATDAQKDLADAIKEVKQQEEDRTLQLKDNALAQRQATLDIAESKKELDKLIANPRATKAEIEQARITYEERQLQFTKLSVSQKRLQAEQDQYVKTGVNGTDQVVAAQRKVADSQTAIADSQKAVARALEDQDRQRQQSADAIQSATENLAQAQRSLAQAYKGSGVAGGDALDTLNEKMAKLTPAGQAFAKFIFGLKDELLTLKAPAENGLLPGLQKSIEQLLPYVPALAKYIGAVATALGDAAVQFTASFGDPGWQRFFTFIAEQTVPTLKLLFTVSGNVAEGVRDLFLALTAFNKPIGDGLIKYSESFAKWAAQLSSSQGYKDFLDYVRKVGPDVVDFFGELGKAIIHIVVAAAPVGKVVLGVLDGILQFINSIPTGTLTVIIGAITALSAGALILSGILQGVRSSVDLAKGALDLYRGTIGRLVTAVQGFNTAQEETVRGTGQYAKGMGVVTTATKEAAVATEALGVATKTANAEQAAVSTGQTNVAKTAKVAASEVQELGNNLAQAAGNAEHAGGRFAGLASAFDPIGLAIAGFTALIAYQAVKEGELESQDKDLRDALINLGQAYQQTHSLASTQVQDTIKQNKQLTDLILNTSKYGVSVDQVTKAAAGERDVQQQILDTLKARREELQRQINENPKPLNDPEQQSKVRQILLLKQEEEQLGRTFDEVNKNTDAQNALATATDRSNIHFAGAPQRIQDYVAQLDKLLDPLTTAAEKTDILRQQDESLYGAQRNLQEALEAQAQAHRDLNDVLADKNLLDQKGARALDINTEAGARLTDALEAELTAIRATYLANIQNGDSIEEATKKHDAEIEKLRQSAQQKGLDHLATEKLIEIYGEVPTSRVTTFGTYNFDATRDQLAELMAYQLALKEGITLGQARDKISPQLRVPGSQGHSLDKELATGGPVFGAGTSTSDSIPAWLSNGEFVHRASAVDYYGTGFMEAINQKKLPKKLLNYIGFYANGGEVGYAPAQSYPFNVNAAATRIPSKDEVKAAVQNSFGPAGAGPGFLPWPSSPLAQRGDTGVWKSIVSLVKSSGLPYTFGNAYRPGDPLWHGSGRAVDFMGYNQDALAQFFLDRLPHVLELIHLTPKSGYFVTRGKRKANFAVQGPLHRNHLHIAMAQGGAVAAAAAGLGRGDIPPGWSTAYAGTGNTRMLSSRDLAAMQALSGQQQPGGATNNYHFRDTTLDVPRLRAMQEREAVLARSGRAH